MEYDVFISYSSENTITATRIAEWLETRAGLTCWYTARNLPPDCPNQTDVLLETIEQSSVFLLISSYGATIDHNMQIAVSHAMANEIARVDFKLDSLGNPVYEAIPLGGYQNPDADWELAVYSLARRIKAIIERADSQEEYDHEYENIETYKQSGKRGFVHMLILVIFVTGAVLVYTSYFEGRGVANTQPGLVSGEGLNIEELYERAHEGDAVAQYEYGRIMMITQDFYEATYWFRHAARQDHVQAQMALAHNYRHGLGTIQHTGLDWYWDARAGSTHGIPEWQLQLANIYRLGHIVPMNLERALYWHMQSAEGGFAPAQTWLASMYLTGFYGVEIDYEQAVYWYRQAALQGDANGQTSLGTMYAQGRGVDHSYEEAAYWFRQAAQHEPTWLDYHETGWNVAVAQLNLGTMYEHGFGVETDLAQAAYLYKQAAEFGHPAGQNNFAVMLQSGQGVEQDYQQAVYWFRKSAEGGYPRGAAHLGFMYENGTGVAQDYRQAIYWYQRALDRGAVLYIQGVATSFRPAPDWVLVRLQYLLENS